MTEQAYEGVSGPSIRALASEWGTSYSTMRYWLWMEGTTFRPGPQPRRPQR